MAKKRMPREEARKIRLIIADDHQIVRQGLSTMLAKEPDMDVVGEADNGREAVQLAQELSPDIVIMDVNMPDLNGIEATRQIIHNNPSVKVMGLSMHSDRRFVINMLKAGASGYLLKDSAFEELTHALRLVMANKTYLSPEISDIVIRDYVEGLSTPKSSAFTVLTVREREVLQLLAEGKSTSQIGEHLHISGKTVETHRQQIMQKLGIRSLAELTKYAIREGLTSLEL